MSYQTLRRVLLGLVGLSVLLLAGLSPNRESLLMAYVVPSECLSCAPKGNTPVKVENDCKGAHAAAAKPVKQDPPRKAARRDPWTSLLRGIIL